MIIISFAQNISVSNVMVKNMDITEQVKEELDRMERMRFNIISTNSNSYWECSNCDIYYRPILIPGEEDKYPRCPNCHKPPRLADSI